MSQPQKNTFDPQSSLTDKNSYVHGVTAGFVAHLFWGVAVLYWPLLKVLPAPSLLAHRMLWSCLFLLVILLLTHRWGEVQAALRNRKTMLILAISAALLALNWGLFLWGVNQGRVVECSLGYFITPLLNLLMGRVLLGERVSKAQALAILLAVIGIGFSIVAYGNIPWLALCLACTFACYGYFQKTIRLDAAPTLFLETLIMAPVALVWLAVVHPGDFAIVGYGWARPLLLLGTVAFTAVPLLLFGYAAHNVTLSTIGILQFLSPSISFIAAVTILGEKIKDSDIITFPCIWLAIIIYAWDVVRDLRRMKAQVQPPSPAGASDGEQP